MLLDRGEQGRGVADLRDHLVPAVGQQARPGPRAAGRCPRRSRRARDHRLDARARAGPTVDDEGAAVGAEPVGEPRQPAAGCARRAPPTPSSATTRRIAPSCRAASMRIDDGRSVLDRVGDRLAGDEVGGRLDRARAAARASPRRRRGWGRARELARAAARPSSRLEGRRPAAIVRRSAMARPTSSTASSSAGSSTRADSGSDRWMRRRRMPSPTRRCWAPSWRSRSSRRRSVVAGLDDARARDLHRGELTPQLELQPRQLDRQRRRGEHRAHEVRAVQQLRIVAQHGDLLAVAQHRRRRRAGRVGGAAPRELDQLGALRQAQRERGRRVVEGLAQDGADALRPRSRPSRTASSNARRRRTPSKRARAKRRSTSSWMRAAERAEGERHGRRRRRRDPRRAAARQHAEPERDADPGAGRGRP